MDMTHGRLCFLVLCLFLGLTCTVFASESTKQPHQVIKDLQRRMYVIGETTGRFPDFVEAERKAAKEIRTYMISGDPEVLVAKNRRGQTPLIAAAFMGYPGIVAELLKSDTVRHSIDALDQRGLSAWLSANVALRQTMWTCNPGLLKSPFVLVPLMVTQTYYSLSPTNPYLVTRQLLEEAGATARMEDAKQIWLKLCKFQDQQVRSKVEGSDDLLETVLAESTKVLGQFMAESMVKSRRR